MHKPANGIDISGLKCLRRLSQAAMNPLSGVEDVVDRQSDAHSMCPGRVTEGSDRVNICEKAQIGCRQAGVKEIADRGAVVGPGCALPFDAELFAHSPARNQSMELDLVCRLTAGDLGRTTIEQIHRRQSPANEHAVREDPGVEDRNLHHIMVFARPVQSRRGGCGRISADQGRQRGKIGKAPAQLIGALASEIDGPRVDRDELAGAISNEAIRKGGFDRAMSPFATRLTDAASEIDLARPVMRPLSKAAGSGMNGSSAGSPPSSSD